MVGHALCPKGRDNSEEGVRISTGRGRRGGICKLILELSVKPGKLRAGEASREVVPALHPGPERKTVWPPWQGGTERKEAAEDEGRIGVRLIRQM